VKLVVYPKAIGEAQKAVSYSGRTSRYVAGVGYALAPAGKRDEAHNIIDELVRSSKSGKVSAHYIAGSHSTLESKTKRLKGWRRLINCETANSLGS
jgi:hypothetical protein